MNSMDFAEKRLELIAETKRKIAESITADNFITQSVDAIGEIDRAANILAKRLREWYELYNPELSHNIHDHDVFVRKIVEEENMPPELTMGGKLDDLDKDELLVFASQLHTLYLQKERLVDYIRKKMAIATPHLLEVAGPLIGAKLLAHKGTLRELAFMPASTIQLLGAEKALFRHIRSNAKPPKYGFLLQHQEVAKAENKGKAARQLAGKISIAAKQDYFGGQSNE